MKKWKFKFTLLLLFLLVLGIFPVLAQEMQIKGKVSELSSDEPIPGVNIYVKGTTNGTTTDGNGTYSIKLEKNKTLVFSFIGYTSKEILVLDNTNINVSLTTDAIALEEIVAVGYGTQRKKDLTSAIGSLNSKDIKNQPITEMSQVIQGRVAGVSVTKSSGAPGGQAAIRIRGANSVTGSNEPLYVIDGLVGADFNTINPSDIDDLQILKDASATAIYGSRGANGVVIITTKSGERGEAKISFSANYSVSQVIKKYDLLGAGDYAKTANEYNIALGNSPVFTDQEVQGFYTNGGTDWQDEILRVAEGQDYQLSVSGGGDKSTYYISGSVLNQDGIVINSGYKKYGLRTNITSNITEKLKVKISSNFAHRESLNNTGGGDESGVSGARFTLAQMLTWAPTTSAYDEFGNINPQDMVGSTFENPLEFATDVHKYTSNTFNANGNIIYTFFPGLTLDVGLGINYDNGANKEFTQGLLMGLTSAGASSAIRNGSENTYLANTNVLTYKKVFDKIHNLTLTIVNEQTKEIIDNFGVTATGLLYPEFQYNNLSLLTDDGNLQGTAYTGERKIKSYVGRVNYILKNRYLFSASFRRDGASVFRGDNKWANFPALSAGWNVSEENFFKSEAIKKLKVRSSWGKTGNQAVGIYGTQGQLKSSPPKEITTSFETGIGVAGLIMGDPGNQDLKWETTEQIDFGVDFSLYEKITISADYFKKNTSDLLIYMPIPNYAGGGGMNQNVGEVENKGWEFAINADIIKSGDFSWSSSLNATFIDNKVTKLGRDAFGLGGDIAGTEGKEFLIEEGSPISSFYGFTSLGTWKLNEAAQAAIYKAVPGDAKFQDLQKEGEVGYGVIDSKDKSVIGNGIPKATFGWNNILTYKKFTLNMFFQGMTGFDRWAFAYAQSVTPGRGSQNVQNADILDRWNATTNPNSDIPAFSKTTRTDLLTSRFVMDASFVRLKNLSLSYDLELKGIPNISLMLAGTNLFTITKYKGLDPEAFSSQGGSDSKAGVDAGAYPNSKMYSVSAKINF